MKPTMVLAVAIFGATLGAAPAIGADVRGPIHVVAATFGGRNDANPRDFTATLQKICGETSTYCEAFCAEAFVGPPAERHYHQLGVHGICRVVFRCGELTTQVTEAARNETLILNCRAQQ